MAIKNGQEKGTSRIGTIYRAISRAIMARELKPGTKLQEEEIGLHFDVSRTIVRAALNRLYSESLVEIVQNKGAFVASPTLEEARQVFDARMCIELEVMAKLAENISEKQLEALERHIKKEKDTNLKSDRSSSIVLAGEFHLVAAQMTGNMVLADFLGQLISRSSLILAQNSNRFEVDCSTDEHASILGALRKRDVAAAQDAIRSHINHMIDRANLSASEVTKRSLTDILTQYA